MPNFIRQLPFEYAFRNLGRSPIRLMASILGATMVVLLVLAATGFVRGMERTLVKADSLQQNIILLGTGSEEAIERSQIKTSVQTIAAASIPSIKTEGGMSFVSPEIHIAMPVKLKPGTNATNPTFNSEQNSEQNQEYEALLRGVRHGAYLVHSELEITQGRRPTPGQNEIMVGALAATRLGVEDHHLQIGQTLYLDNQPLTIVGQFQAPSTVMDAEIWIPLPDLQVITKRESTLSCVIISLDPNTSFQTAFAEADFFTKTRLDLEITAIREADYYASLNTFYKPIKQMVLITAALIASGGLLGGLNTMYAAFAARVREVGMLQSLGFTRLAILLNLSEESLFAAGCGTALGVILGQVLLDGIAVRFSMGAFQMQLDPPVLLTGIAAGLLVGLIGAIPPGIRCLRLPITNALKSV